MQFSTFTLRRLTSSPEYARWVADKRKWGLKDIAKAAMLLATVIGVTSVAVQPQLWPVGLAPASPPFGSPAQLQHPGATAQAGAPAVDATFGISAPRGSEGRGWMEVAESKFSGVADRLIEPKHKLEAQLKSGQTYIKVRFKLTTYHTAS